jgi:hypothetical protein
MVIITVQKESRTESILQIPLLTSIVDTTICGHEKSRVISDSALVTDN